MLAGTPYLHAQQVVNDTLSPPTASDTATRRALILADTSFARVNESLPDTVAMDTVVQDTTSADSTSSKSMFTDVIHYQSKDTMRISLDSKKVFFYGDAEIKYTTTELQAEHINMDLDKKEAFATGVTDSLGKEKGTPKFKDGGQSFDSKELKYNFETGKGFVKHVIMQEGEGYIQGRLTKRMSDSIYCVKDGWYTTCDQHDHPHFYIHMNKAKMIKDKKVVAGVSYLVIEDVPLPIGIPFGFFPITKSGTSGVIMPTYGEERLRGFNLRNGGYYWAINDYVDLSITGDIYTNGSWGSSIISNYRKKYKYSGNFSFTISRNHTGEKELKENYNESQDWALRWTHTQDPKANPYSTFSASVDMSSSSSNYYNASTINDISNQRKQSSISWSKKWPDRPFSLSTAFSHNQNTSDSSLTISFPNINFKVSSIYPFRKKGKSGNLKWYDNLGFTYSAELKNTIKAPEKEFMDTPFKKWSNGFKHSIPLSTSINLMKDVSFSPSVSYTGVIHTSSIRKEWVDTTSDGKGYVRIDTIQGLNYAHNYSASASIGYNPTIYGTFMFKPESKVFAIRHVVRPSVSLTYTPNFGVDRDKYKREYVDGAGNIKKYSIYEGKMYNVPETPEKSSGVVAMSLTNNVEMKVRKDPAKEEKRRAKAKARAGEDPDHIEEEEESDEESKSEYKKVKLLESFSISTSYNIFADSMNWSNIALSARTTVFRDRVGINLSATIDPYMLTAQNVRVNRFSGGVGRLTSLSLSTSMSLSSDNGNNKEKKNEQVGGFYDQYMDFDVPWSFNFDYTMSMNTSYSANPDPNATKPLSERKITQNLRVNGDFSLTPKWKFGFSSGYDFDNHEITATSFNISRDLHCWDMTFSCIPFGTHQSFNFQINVRSSLLKDLKLTKRSSFYDRI
ncbi:LPS-assembly protein LptD [Porphyromonadaceae bacterium OttesenSCG-928-L07]|nr:LPS-assembly protein LptD [Porphyromonadaceae bacterium OttesenSCG-928-L07]MDL2251948.1 LPS-assembly protein LptD [Odoribacter sp. OttesenSCG-928-J03]